MSVRSCWPWLSGTSRWIRSSTTTGKEGRGVASISGTVESETAAVFPRTGQILPEVCSELCPDIRCSFRPPQKGNTFSLDPRDTRRFLTSSHAWPHSPCYVLLIIHVWLGHWRYPVPSVKRVRTSHLLLQQVTRHAPKTILDCLSELSVSTLVRVLSLCTLIVTPLLSCSGWPTIIRSCCDGV